MNLNAGFCYCHRYTLLQDIWFSSNFKFHFVLQTDLCDNTNTIHSLVTMYQCQDHFRKSLNSLLLYYIIFHFIKFIHLQWMNDRQPPCKVILTGNNRYTSVFQEVNSSLFMKDYTLYLWRRSGKLALSTTIVNGGQEVCSVPTLLLTAGERSTAAGLYVHPLRLFVDL